MLPIKNMKSIYVICFQEPTPY